MPTTPPDAQIRARIDQFLEELNVLVRSAATESIREALGFDAPMARRGRPAGPARRRGRPARAGKKIAKRKRGRPAKAKTAPGKPTSGKPGRRKRRSSGDVAKTGEQVQDFVAANPGSGLSAIAAALKRPSKDLTRSLRGLVASKALRTEGQRRGTKYFVK